MVRRYRYDTPRLGSKESLSEQGSSLNHRDVRQTEEIVNTTQPTRRACTCHSTGEDKTSPKKITTIRASILIPGDADPIHDGAVVIEDKLIAFVGEQSDLPLGYAAATVKQISVPVVMPGLWDCHVHLIADDLDGTGSYSDLLTTHPASAGARIVRTLWELLQAGFTSVREPGGYGLEISKPIREGIIVGPNIYSSGAVMSQTAGHGDVFKWPAGDVYLNNGVSSIHPGHFGASPFCMVDGVDECRRGVRLQLRRGANLIKVTASGGIMSENDDPKFQQFSEPELKVIVEEAGRVNRIVAAHAHGKPGMLAAIRAGCKTIEHGSYGDEEVFELMKEKDVMLIATRSVFEYIMPKQGKGIPPESWEKLKAVDAQHLAAYRLAVKSGVKIALGTDIDGSPTDDNDRRAWNATEIEYAVKAGMTPLEAIKAATAIGPMSLGPYQAPKSGILKVGYDADIIALDKSPLPDVKVLQKRELISHVWKGGKLFKGEGVGPWGE